MEEVALPASLLPFLHPFGAPLGVEERTLVPLNTKLALVLQKEPALAFTLLFFLLLLRSFGFLLLLNLPCLVPVLHYSPQGYYPLQDLLCQSQCQSSQCWRMGRNVTYYQNAQLTSLIIL